MVLEINEDLLVTLWLFILIKGSLGKIHGYLLLDDQPIRYNLDNYFMDINARFMSEIWVVNQLLNFIYYNVPFSYD